MSSYHQHYFFRFVCNTCLIRWDSLSLIFPQSVMMELIFETQSPLHFCWCLPPFGFGEFLSLHVESAQVCAYVLRSTSTYVAPSLLATALLRAMAAPRTGASSHCSSRARSNCFGRGAESMRRINSYQYCL
jgi:hypothetical protein